MKLELGSGGRPTPGYTTLDIRPDVGADLVDDAATLGTVDAGSCEVIRAAHLLEHFGHRETITILGLWRSKLAPGGLLEIEVPNLIGHMESWRRGEGTDRQLVVGIFGEQDYPENTHRTMFTPGTLHDSLGRAGFRDVQIRDIGLVLLAWARR